VTKAEQLEANRWKVQQHRQRQKEEEENDTGVIQQDDTAGLLQTDENGDVEQVVGDLQEDLDPYDLYNSSPKAKTQSQSNKKDDDNDTIQKTIADFSTIRLDSVSPVKSTRRRKPTVPAPLPATLPVGTATAIATATPAPLPVPTVTPPPYQLATVEDDDSDTIQVGIPTSQSATPVSRTRRRKQQERQHKRAESESRIFSDGAVTWLEEQLTSTFGCETHVTDIDSNDDEESCRLSELSEYWKDNGVPDVLNDNCLLSRESGLAMSINWKSVLSDNSPSNYAH
jgi:hypothetical protein